MPGGLVRAALRCVSLGLLLIAVIVFRFDADTSTVRRVPVEIEDLHDNEVQIAGDLSAGDIIATAGVEFLADGQEVRLMGNEMPYGEGA